MQPPINSSSTAPAHGATIFTTPGSNPLMGTMYVPGHIQGPLSNVAFAIVYSTNTVPMPAPVAAADALYVSLPEADAAPIQPVPIINSAVLLDAEEPEDGSHAAAELVQTNEEADLSQQVAGDLSQDPATHGFCL